MRNLHRKGVLYTEFGLCTWFGEVRSVGTNAEIRELAFTVDFSSRDVSRDVLGGVELGQFTSEKEGRMSMFQNGCISPVLYKSTARIFLSHL